MFHVITLEGNSITDAESTDTMHMGCQTSIGLGIGRYIVILSRNLLQYLSILKTRRGGLGWWLWWLYGNVLRIYGGGI